MDEREEREDAWRQYESHKDLYKFYVSQVFDFHKFYLPLVGALIVYALANRVGAVAASLLLPLVLSMGGIATFAFGFFKARELTENMRAIAARIGMLPAHTEVLQFLCLAFLLVHVLLSAALGFLFVELGGYVILELPPPPPRG